MSVNSLFKCLHYLVVILPFKLIFQSVQIIIVLHLILSVDQLTDATASLLFFSFLVSFIHIKAILKECQSVFFSSFLSTLIIFCLNNRVLAKENTIIFNDLGHSMRSFVVDLFKNKPRCCLIFNYAIKIIHMF
jgi:hypothetical protein